MTESKCDDPYCPICGQISIRGRRSFGKIVSDKARKTVVVEKEETIYFPKYKRYAKRRSKIPAHNSSCIGAKIGDYVEIGESRKISKTKSWIVIRILKEMGEKI